MIQDFQKIQDVHDIPDFKGIPDSQVIQGIPEVQKVKGEYHKISLLVDRQLQIHQGETFDLDMICRWLSITERDNRNDVAEKLHYEVRRGNLEKNNRLYRVLVKDIERIDWMGASDWADVPFNWPKGRDGSRFPFDGHITMRPTDLFVISGTSNMGKSTLARNIVWENMDDWNGKLTYMVNEYQPSRFKRLSMLMDWKNPLNDDGTPKFELVRRLEDWQYAIEPDHLNVIDWISMDDEFYKIGTIMKEIQKRLRDGIAVIVIQKAEGKTLGLGGQFGEHFASYYWSVDLGRVFFKKAKEYGKYNPNGRMYGFNLAEGAYLNDIHEVKKCLQCAGTGERFDRNAGGKVHCIGCEGKGWL